jgi:hypothetical protein
MDVRPTSAAPQQSTARERAGLSKGQKTLGICLLLFYVAMIAITIATLPYATHSLADGSLF